MNKIFFTVIALLLSNTLMFGQEKIITLEDKNDLMLIGKSAYFLEDVNGEMTIEDILKPENQDKFILNDKDVFARSATNSAYWFKFTVKNLCEEDAWLEVGSTFALYIDFYTPDSLGRYQKPYMTGTLRSGNPKFYDIINAFWLPLSKTGNRQAKIYYLRITQQLAFQAPLRVGTLRSLNHNKVITDSLTAGFMGAMLIMLLYNIFLLLSTKDIIYIWYLGYLFCLIFLLSFLHNYPIVDYLGFMFDNHDWWHLNYTAWGAPTFLFIASFAIHYLQLNKRLRLIRYIILFLTFCLVLVIPTMTLYGINTAESLNFYQLCVLLLYLSCLFTSYYLAFRGEKQARYYALGWTFYITSAFIFVCYINGIIAYNIFAANSLYFGAIMEVWMFSLALGDRINILRKENKRILEEQNAKLELAVTERTEELQVMNEELNSSVEELSLTLEILDEQKKTIEVINNKITTSIDYAQTIQGAVLPNEEYLEAFLPEHFLIYRPKDIVSGDFYWLHPLKDGLIVVVADCTGHGVAGSFMSLIGINLLDNMEWEMEVLSPAEIISKLNIAVEKALKQGERNSYNEGMDIAVCKINHARGREIDVEFSGAKRPLYYTRHGNHSLMSIEGDRKSVGSGINPPYEFQNHRITLAKGDMVYLCSDGFEDQNNLKRKKFRETQLKNILGEISQKNVQEQREILIRQLEAHQMSAEQRDDITLMGIRLN